MTFRLEASLGFLVNRAATAMRSALEEALRPHDLTAPQWAVLARLLEEDGQPISSVGRALGFDKPTMSGIVMRLEKKAFVAKRRSSSDGRLSHVHLTGAGRSLVTGLTSLAEKVNARALRSFSAAQKAELELLLGKVRANLD